MRRAACLLWSSAATLPLPATEATARRSSLDAFRMSWFATTRMTVVIILMRSLVVSFSALTFQRPLTKWTCMYVWQSVDCLTRCRLRVPYHNASLYGRSMQPSLNQSLSSWEFGWITSNPQTLGCHTWILNYFLMPHRLPIPKHCRVPHYNKFVIEYTTLQTLNVKDTKGSSPLSFLHQELSVLIFLVANYVAVQ